MGKGPEKYYSYNALSADSIRLVKIHPSKSYQKSVDSGAQTTDIQEQIEISLEAFEILECPPYTALSYTWGLPGSHTDPIPTVFTQVERVFPIICESAILLGTWNLRSALRFLRYAYDVVVRLDDTMNQTVKDMKDIHVNVAYIWIDALCINQEDLQERSQQVRLMRHIYRQARRTLIWLGEEDKFTKDATDALALVQASIEQSMEQLRRHPQRPAHVTPVNIESPQTIACSMLLTRNWFTRYWTLQEAILSKEVLVFVGDRVNSFNVYERARTLAQLSAFGGIAVREAKDDRRGPIQAYANIKTLSFIEDARQETSKGQLPDFVSLMLACRSQNCYDPRDRIYSILGICSEFCKDGELLLEPDYTKPVAQIYLEATSFIIRARKDLAVLTLVSLPKDTPGLPSWCPDYLRWRSTVTAFTKESRIWRFPSPPDRIYQVSDRSLEVFGQCIGTVCERSSLFHERDKKGDQSKEWLSTGVLPVCDLVTRVQVGGSRETSQLQNYSRVELMWRTFMSRFETCFSQLADWWQETLPSGAGLLLPQLLRCMLIMHLLREVIGKGDDPMRVLSQQIESVPHENLKLYAQLLESALPSLLVDEPQNAAFLPNPGELGKICLDSATDWERSGSTILESNDKLHSTMRRKATELCLDLPESFTRLPQVRLGDPKGPESFKKSAYWTAGFFSAIGMLPPATKVFRITNHLFGMTSCLLEVDDQIWILDGAHAPVCLRPLEGDRYQFLGDARMYGLMYGEAVTFCKNPVSIMIE